MTPPRVNPWIGVFAVYVFMLPALMLPFVTFIRSPIFGNLFLPVVPFFIAGTIAFFVLRAERGTRTRIALVPFGLLSGFVLYSVAWRLYGTVHLTIVNG